MRKVLSKLLYALSFIFGIASLTFSFLIEAGPDIGIWLSYPIHPFLLLLLVITPISWRTFNIKLATD
jgi:uncharacterized membrane protein